MGVEVKTTGYVWKFLTNNQAPTVNAGDDQVVRQTDTVALNGTVEDDGLPSGQVTQLWTGPAGVIFDDATAVDTTATFPDYGTYVLRLTATDTQLEGYDEMEVYIPTCADARNDGFAIDGDLGGPLGEPDCRVDLYDFALMAGNWLECNDPTNSVCDWVY